LSKFDDLPDDLPPKAGPPEPLFPPEATKSRPKPKANGDGSPHQPEVPIPQGESAFSLVERDIPEPVRLCDPWATEGVNIIAGRPKLGKTTLERQKMAAAVSAGPFLDSQFDKPCLCAFLSLEEGDVIARSKFIKAGYGETALAGIQIHFSWERGKAGVDMLHRYLVENQDIRFVCIDSLSRFRALPDVRVAPFMADYEAVNMLHELSKLHRGVCIDVVHHTRKARSEDPIDDISGTYGLTAACDAYAVLRHHSDGASMFVGGRLWSREDSQYLLRRENQGWEMLGVNLGLSDEQQQTLELIRRSSNGLSGTELAEKLGISQPSAWQRIDLLIEKGFVVKRFGRAHLKGSTP